MALDGLLAGIAGGATVSIVISAIDNFSPVMKNINKGLLGLGAGITAAGLAGVGVFTSLALEASSAEETFNKFGAVFEDSIGSAESAVTDLKVNFGLATSSAKELLSSTGDLLTGFGVSGDEAVKLSNQVSRLGVDLASFQNLQGGAKQAVDILNKALLGERESLTTLGVKVLESDVQNKLLEKGQADLTGTALLQAKAYATLELVLQQTGKAQGDYARTSNSTENQMRLLNEKFKELKQSLGKEILPLFTDLVGIAVKVLDKFNNLSSGTKRFIVITGALFTGLALVVGPLLIIAAILPAIVTGVGLLFGPIGALIGLIALLTVGIGYLIAHFDTLKEGAILAWKAITETIEKSINFIIRQINKLIDIINLIPGVDIGKLNNVRLSSTETPSLRLVPQTTININNVNGFNGRDIARELGNELDNVIRL